MRRPGWFGKLAMMAAALAGVQSAPRVETASNAPAAVRSGEQAVARGKQTSAPATSMNLAARRSLGIVDAAPIHWHRVYSPIWVGRPRSKYGRCDSARV